MPVTSDTLAGGAGKFISDRLIALSDLMFRFRGMANDVPLPKGMGKTAEFVKYNRMDVEMGTLTEGVTPAEKLFTISTQTIQADQYGLYTSMTDVSEFTTKHPVLNQAITLLSDAVFRMKEFHFVEILNAGTNVQYADGSIATRDALAPGDILDKTVLTRATVNLTDSGVPAREGEFYVAIMGAQVIGDMLNATGDTSFSAMANRQDKSALLRGQIAQWQGVTFVKTNFLPKFVLLASPAAVGAAGGAIAVPDVYLKVTRASLSRGFKEAISAEIHVVMGGNTRVNVPLAATAGFVYDIYVGSASGDSNLFLAAENQAAGATVAIDSIPIDGANPPATPPAGGLTVHPIYIFGADAADKVALNELSMMGSVTPKGASDSDPLQQRRKVGSKWMDKEGIRDQTRILRVEVVSAY